MQQMQIMIDCETRANAAKAANAVQARDGKPSPQVNIA